MSATVEQQGGDPAARPLQGPSVGHLSVRGVLQDGVATLRLSGEVDLASAQSVRAAVCDALDEGATEILLDLESVTLLDSTGLSVLLHCARDAHRRRCRFHCEAPLGHESRVVIALAGVGNLLGLEEADGNAVARPPR
jgi:anti-anti-sigma factor